MRNLLLQLDSSRNPSVFDRIVALDAGADEVMAYGAVDDAAVRDLVHGVLFTRAPKDLRHSAVFVGGAEMESAERLWTAVKETFFGPFRVSVMFDPNGSNTTAVAAIVQMRRVAGDLRGRRAVITAGTGPVGMRSAGLLALAGADVVITSRSVGGGERAVDGIQRRFGTPVRAAVLADHADAPAVLDGAALVLNAGGAGARLVPRDAWVGRPGLIAAVDLNAVPPYGIEGIEVSDGGLDRGGTVAFGAVGVGGFKMKLHKACIARLFERNDLVLDAESINELALSLAG